MEDGRIAIYDFSHSGINASTYHTFSSLRIYDAEGRLIQESSIPVALADFDHDEIRITEDGRLEIIRHYNNRSTVDVFNQDGMLQGSDGQWFLVSTVFENPNSNPLTRYESHGTVVYGMHVVGQEMRLVPTEIISAAGNHFEFQYASDSFIVTEVILRNSAGEVVLSASWNASSQRFEVLDQISGMVFPRVLLTHPGYTTFECMLKVLEQLAKVIQDNIPYFRNLLYDYLGATMGLTREEIDARFIIVTEGQISQNSGMSTVYFRDLTNSEFYVFNRNMRGTRLQIGQRIVEIDLQGHLVSEKISGVISRTFYYSLSGVLLGYQDSVGAIYVLAGGRFGGAQIASEVVNNQRVVYIGYPDRGFRTYAEAVQALQDFRIDLSQTSVIFDIAAPLLATPSSIAAGVPTTLSLPWMEGATGLEIQVARDENFSDIAYSATVSDPGMELNLSEGNYFIRVRAIFGETVQSNWANAVLIVETSATPVPVIQMVGTVPALTNIAALTVNYTVDGVAQVATFTLQEGENAGLQIAVRDAEQSVVASYDLPAITLDTQAPVIVVTSQIPEVTNQAQLTVTYTVDGGTVQTGTFTLAEGDNTGLVLTAVDTAGNQATYALPGVALDTELPVIVVTSQVPAVTDQSVLTVTYTVDGGAVQTQTFTLVEGDNTGFTITATDAAGNRYSQDLPAIRYELPNLGETGIRVTEEVPEITSQNQITINYSLNGVAQTQSFQLTEGLNQLVLNGQDRDGKPVERTFSVVLDTVAPVIALEGELPEVLPIDSLFVTYTVDGESRMIVLPLEEGDNTDLQITAMDAAGNEGVLRLPNVRYEKPPVVGADNASGNLVGGTESGDDQKQAQGTPVSLADFRAYLQTRTLSLLQRSRVNQSLGLVSAGAFVYRYETASGTQYSWTESTGRTVVFSFENNTLLFGELLTRILS
jgi:hypothetical protein